MRHARMSAVLILTTLVCLSTIGCQDEMKAKDAQISLIEDQNQRLTEDLATARSDNDLLSQSQEQIRQQLLAAQRENGNLRNDLANIPEPVAVADGWQAVPGGYMIAIPGNVLFAPGKATLRKSGKTALESVASAVRGQYGDKDIFVFGHTDDQPIKKSGWKDNFELSSERALSVVRQLRDRGIDPSTLVACGAGEHRPRVPNSSDKNRSQNRRVEIFAVDPIR